MRRRLAFIRYIHHLGVDQASLPEPPSSASILMFHDAVEGFLLLAAEHHGVTPPTEFEKYWQVLKTTAGVGLPIRQGMKRLNKIRVNLKHNGSRPDQETIDQARSDTTALFQEATPLAFGLDHATVSMADLISYQPVRELVREAETASAGGDHITAMIALADASKKSPSHRRRLCCPAGSSGTTATSDAHPASHHFPRSSVIERHAPVTPFRRSPGRGASPVPAITIGTFRAPYAKESLAAAHSRLLSASMAFP
ncbi:hypothetical protein GCM10022226_73970 [Sphaerisporangium flaviroseum]|uniref:Uncharacterized protein n=1 Tax=Sphaerisporangium flaviroseum TaxID=509199 RepID=A0ABP7JC15_9ACTN